MRAGEVLELFATEGLRPEAVHRTRLRVGEGLVGVIAATAMPLALADAQSHPDFAYRPETGEEIYHSLMGVPILRGGPRPRRDRGAEPHAAALHRGRDRGAANHRHGAGRARRLGRIGEPDRAPDLDRDRPIADAPRWHQAPWRARHRTGGAARAAPRDPPGRGRGSERRARPAAARGRADAARHRRADGGERRRLWRRASRHSRDLPHVRGRPWLAAPDLRGGDERPHRGGGGAEGPKRHARAHESGDRSLSARAAGRSRGSYQSLAAASRRPRRHRRGGRAARRIHPGRAQYGARRAVGLRPAALEGAGARRRLAQRPCRRGRAGARHSGRRPGQGRLEPRRGRRSHRR